MQLDRLYIMHVLWPKRTGKKQEVLARDIGFDPSTYSALANTDSTGIYKGKIIFTYKKAVKLVAHLESSNPECMFFSRYEVQVVTDLDIYSEEQKEDLMHLLSTNVPETYEQLPHEVLARELHTIHKELDRILVELNQMQADVNSDPVELDSSLYLAVRTRNDND